MKVLSLCTVLVCVAGGLAGPVLLPVVGNKVGKQLHAASDATNQFRDVANVAHKGQQSVAGNKDHGRTNAIQEDAANRVTNALQQSAQSYGQQSANKDNNNKNQAQSANRASGASYNQHAARNNAVANSDHTDQLWTANRHYNNGNNRNDDINYAYDKKFDLNDNQNGAYDYSQSASSNAKDNFYDRNTAYDRNIDQYGSSASAADKQANSRAAQSKQNSAANQVARDNFGRDAANNQQLWANQKVANNKLDTANQANRDTGLLDNRASGVNQANYLRGGNYKQQGAANKLANQAGYGGTLSPYYLGNLGPSASSYGPSLLYGDSGLGLGKAAGTVNFGSANDVVGNSQLQNVGQWGVQDNSRNAYNKDFWSNDYFQGVGDNRANALSDHGFADKGNAASQTANQALSDKAAAAATKNQDQALSNLNEDALFREVSRQATSDRNNNQKVYKRYFDNDNQNGNNWERLKYDRDLGDNVNGFENQFQRQQGFKDVAQADKLVQSTNGRQADAARANQAASENQLTDWQRTGNGYQNALAAADNKDAAARKGLDNRVWKYERDQKAADNLFQNQASRDQGGSFFNNGAALKGGAFLGTYPSSGGYNFGGSLPGFHF